MKDAGEMIVYFNGRFVRKDDVCISPDDRGFVFADGIYEVVRTYGGRLFRAEDHFLRMTNSLRALRIDGPAAGLLEEVILELMQANGLPDAVVYIQVTRGAAPRKHVFPPPETPPTVYASVAPPAPYRPAWDEGAGVILVPDIRWARCDIKSVSLLPNVMASQQAHEQGAIEAVFVRDGIVTEGSHTNVAAVIDGEFRTYPTSNYILPGVTRTVVLELCAQHDIPYREEPLPAQALPGADELLILGTSTEVMPIVRVDGWQVGNGKPGPVTLKLQKAFRDYACAG